MLLWLGIGVSSLRNFSLLIFFVPLCENELTQAVRLSAISIKLNAQIILLSSYCLIVDRVNILADMLRSKLVISSEQL